MEGRRTAPSTRDRRAWGKGGGGGAKERTAPPATGGRGGRTGGGARKNAQLHPRPAGVGGRAGNALTAVSAGLPRVGPTAVLQNTMTHRDASYSEAQRAFLEQRAGTRGWSDGRERRRARAEPRAAVCRGSHERKATFILRKYDTTYR